MASDNPDALCSSCNGWLRSGNKKSLKEADLQSSCYLCIALNLSRSIFDGGVNDTSAELEAIERDEREYTTDVVIYSDQLAGQQLGESGRFIICENSLDLSLVSSWLSTCENEHGSECSESKYSEATVKGASVFLIDVENMSIVETSIKTRFVALSYVWGHVEQLKLVKDSLDAFKQPHSLRDRVSEIPGTIRHAMRLVSGIGERYLWVDSLCIVQDDPEQKAIQIAQMAAIYDGAVLTMVALVAENANTPLPGMCSGSRNPDILTRRSGLLIAREPTNIMGLGSIFHGTKHNERAWTFQEVKLSRRCLFLAKDQVYFQCQSANSKESTADKLRPIYVQNDAGNYPPISTTSTIGAFRLEEVILNFSRRDLTFPEDRLDAFAAITRAFKIADNLNFSYGLVHEYWNWALLWLPFERKSKPYKDVERYAMFPSWSWLSFKGGIFHAGYFRGPMPFAAAIDWSWATLWDGKESRNLLSGTQSGGTALQGRTPGTLIFGANVLNIKHSHITMHNGDQSSSPGILFDPEPLGSGDFPTPLDHYATSLPADEFPPNITNLVSTHGAWCGALVGIPPSDVLDMMKDLQDSAEFYLIALSVARINWSLFWLDFDKDKEETDEWRFMNVMFVIREERDWKRIAIGQVLFEAWDQASTEPELVWLV